MRHINNMELEKKKGSEDNYGKGEVSAYKYHQ